MENTGCVEQEGKQRLSRKAESLDSAGRNEAAGALALLQYEEGATTHSTLPGEFPLDRKTWWATVHGVNSRT